MAYLQRDPARRIAPETAWPWVRSVIVCAKTYFREHPAVPVRGRIARYALGTDYHESMRAALQNLADWISRETGTRCRVAVDTSPILEKALAAKAGIGWIGKNTLVLRRGLGSYFFLGEVLTELDPPREAAPRKNGCARCRRCIDICPTGAIVAPYILDSRRCISYLTIEFRGVIPREFRVPMGMMVFGCDLCQEVCPWNLRARRIPPPALGLVGDPTMEEMTRWLSLTPAEFRKEFRGTALVRARREGLMRNVAVALGNSGSVRAVRPLARALRDESALVRLHAAWGLGRLGFPEAREELQKRRVEETDPEVLREIERALSDAAERGTSDAGNTPVRQADTGTACGARAGNR